GVSSRDRARCRYVHVSKKTGACRAWISPAAVRPRGVATGGVATGGVATGGMATGGWCDNGRVRGRGRDAQHGPGSFEGEIATMARKILIAFGVLLALLVVAAVVLVLSFDANRFKPR